ncbi:hypothetical protein M422DRAFT_248552 [Sphaerobolus stellatus SS14]|nr:hypothetical protein M422DRAFT_248552 [Sphaerobolus stellatus SS14]
MQFWETEKGQIHDIVIHLHSKWTHHYTCTINQTFLKDQEIYPKPVNWEDILSYWTVHQIQDVFHAPAIQLHKYHLTGLPHGPRQLSFRDRFNAFSSPLETQFSLSSVWHILKTTGYLKNYHHFLTTKSEQDILSLQDGLKAAFELLECLPAKASGVNSQPWKYHSERGGPCFIVNAKAYKIRSVGFPKKNTNVPCPRAVATHTRIDALLIADHLQVSFNDALKLINGYNHQAHKQGKCTVRNRNKRKPPPLKDAQSRASNQSEVHPEVQEISQEHLEFNSRDHVEDEQSGEDEDEDGFSIENHPYTLTQHAHSLLTHTEVILLFAILKLLYGKGMTPTSETYNIDSQPYFPAKPTCPTYLSILHFCPAAQAYLLALTLSPTSQSYLPTLPANIPIIDPRIQETKPP